MTELERADDPASRRVIDVAIGILMGLRGVRSRRRSTTSWARCTTPVSVQVRWLELWWAWLGL